RGDLRGRSQRPLEGHRRADGAAGADVEHGVRGGRARSGGADPRGRPRLLPGRAPHALHRGEPRELPHLGAPGLRDPARGDRPPLSRWRHHGGQSRLPHARRRGRTRLPALPDPQLRQGPAHADPASRQRRPHPAQPRYPHRRELTRVDLGRAVGEALERLSREPGVREVQVFAALNRALLARLNYTSHIACNGVEEPKSTEMSGLGVHAVFDGPAGRPLVGYGSEPSDLSLEGARRALAKARQAAVHDPAFHSLPRPTGEARTLAAYHDPRLMALSDAELVESGWTVIAGALRAFMASSRLADLAGDEAGLNRLGLILGGDVMIRQEHIAVPPP